MVKSDTKYFFFICYRVYLFSRKHICREIHEHKYTAKKGTNTEYDKVGSFVHTENCCVLNINVVPIATLVHNERTAIEYKKLFGSSNL
jgi:hypothetical protein